MIDMFDGFDNKRIEQYTVPGTTRVDLRLNEFSPKLIWIDIFGSEGGPLLGQVPPPPCNLCFLRRKMVLC